jgi:hypothetical protein
MGVMPLAEIEPRSLGRAAHIVFAASIVLSSFIQFDTLSYAGTKTLEFNTVDSEEVTSSN